MLVVPLWLSVTVATVLMGCGREFQVSVSLLIAGGSEEMLNVYGAWPESDHGAPMAGKVLMKKFSWHQEASLEGTSKDISVYCWAC